MNKQDHHIHSRTHRHQILKIVGYEVHLDELQKDFFKRSFEKVKIILCLDVKLIYI